MTLVTEGGREMNIEEKKEWLKARKDRIKLDFECDGIDCYYCPFLGNPDHIEVTKKSEDPINPDHYKAGKLQTIEQMLIMFGIDEVTAFCKLNAYKYQARAGLKGDAVMDHKKADWYMRLYKEIRYCNSITSGLNKMKDFLKEEEKENAADH